MPYTIYNNSAVTAGFSITTAELRIRKTIRRNCNSLTYGNVIASRRRDAHARLSWGKIDAANPLGKLTLIYFWVTRQTSGVRLRTSLPIRLRWSETRCLGLFRTRRTPCFVASLHWTRWCYRDTRSASLQWSAQPPGAWETKGAFQIAEFIALHYDVRPTHFVWQPEHTERPHGRVTLFSSFSPVTLLKGS